MSGSWILFLCILLGPHFVTAIIAVDSPRPEGAIRSAGRRPGRSRFRELQATGLASNLSMGLSRDESILLSWRNSSAYLVENWVSSNEGPCGWPGVRCGDWRGLSRVTGVSLVSVNLTGPVPGRICSLRALTSLSFAGNNLSGNIPPELGNCVNLQELNFTDNCLTGNIPPELGRLINIKSLDLSRNQLSGSIPSGLFANCNNMNFFNVSSNNLTGSLPVLLSSCPNLRTVDIGNNSFYGEIPQEFGQLNYLEELVMGDNNAINGSIPDSLLSNCESLSKLDVAWNSLTGLLSPKLGNCSNLEMLIMQGNHFTGSIPGELGNLKKLRLLGLGNNNFSGSLPQNFSQCDSLEVLDVGNNGLTGTIPTWLGQLPNLKIVTFQINKFVGTIPVEMTTLKLVRYIDLSNNSLQGTVLPEFGNMSSLRLLRLSFNNLTGNIPTQLGFLYKLQGLDLSSNFLNGTIPKTLGNLQDLLWLQLGNNSLTGRIPQSLTNCSSLMWLNLAHNHLRGKIPELGPIGWDSDRVFRQNQETPWILDAVGECSILSTWSPEQSQHFQSLLDVSDPKKCHRWLPLLVQGALKLRSSRLLGEDKVLRYWQLGRNNLSGPLPDLQNATIGFLILSENQLQGPIPEHIGDQPLYNFNVSYNRLNGSIPNSLGNASLLITLDMAYNDLSGEIPSELGDLYALTVLNVSYNPKLSGSIPRKGQFTTLGWEPYIGDVNLCFNDTDPKYTQILANLTVGTTNIPKLCSQVLGGISSNEVSTTKTMKILEIGLTSTFCTISALLLLSSLYCVIAKWRKRMANVMKDVDVWSPSHTESHWRSTGKPHANWSKSSLVASFGMPCLKSLTYAHLEQATANFSEDNILGDGGFGIVYKAKLANGTTVAIKKLVQNGAQGPREFQAEMETLGQIHHENLVSLLGYCCYNEEMLLVYEYFVNGSLDDWLYESEEEAAKLLFPLRIRIALETARGLAFLHHGCTHLIIHRDMKSSNILLNESFKAVLTDFGMARIMDIDCSHVSTVVAGTPGYVPPEYSQTWRATTKGDVYSFGVVMLELLSGKRPTGPHFNGKCGSNLIEMARILVAEGNATAVCDENVLRSGKAEAISAFLDLAMRCTKASPLNRPAMLEVVQTLETIAALNPTVEKDGKQAEHKQV